ncbi:hypothetical protein [Nocardioides pantholopis]|uniref:hypothetical protein n=1 Tax=Nocardioides pantholopis TaxID=2483798 RepID=UPI000F079A60|nr:hypothetical protein [Nocardioides pantholopis]
MSAAESASRPAAYRLATPADWWRIDLEPAARAASINRLVDLQVPADDQPLLRRQIRAELEQRAEQAYRSGGVELHLSRMMAGPMPVAASLVVSLVPGAPQDPARAADGEQPGLAAATAETLAEVLAVSEDPDVSVDSCEVRREPPGPAVRRELTTRTPPPPGDPVAEELGPVPGFTVEWFVPVPNGAGACLLLAFSSPLVTLRDQLTGLFDAVAETLRWSG